MKPRSHLLVDGANVLHAWREAGRGTIDAARARLLQRLAVIRDEEVDRVTVVFDGRGPKMVVESAAGAEGVSVVHTPAGMTADDVIERLVGQAVDAGACVVISGDRGIIETVVAAGARAMLPADLLAWVERVEQRQAARARDRNAANTEAWRRP